MKKFVLAIIIVTFAGYMTLQMYNSHQSKKEAELKRVFDETTARLMAEENVESEKFEREARKKLQREIQKGEEQAKRQDKRDKLNRLIKEQESLMKHFPWQDAERMAKNLLCKNGGTVDQCLNTIASSSRIEDLGWITVPYNNGYDIERLMLLDGVQKLSYKWRVESNRSVEVVNQEARKITR